MSKKLFKGLITFFIFLFFLSGCLEKLTGEKEKTSSTSGGSENKKTSSKTAEVKKIKVILYYPDKEAQFLRIEEAEITSTPTILEATLERLLEGPQSKDLTNPFPSGVKIVGISLKDGLLEVDFDQNLKELYPRGSSAENMFIYSIVNTATEFPEVKKVKFLVGGRPEEIVGSNYDFRAQEFTRDEALIAN